MTAYWVALKISISIIDILQKLKINGLCLITSPKLLELPI